MYYQNYEDYIRNILGYPVQSSNNMYQNSTYNYSNENYDYVQNISPRYSNEIIELYPEIYKIINPMVCKICEANSKPITRELLEQMTDEIYLNIEGDTNLEEDTTINVRVNVPSSKDKTAENRTKLVNASKQTGLSTSKQPRREENFSSNVEKRQFRRNNALRDLIKILILNQLLGGNRPPHRPHPRPPFPGGPRPPINPRDGYNFI